MFADYDSYGDEDQNTDMELIDSRDWPSEPVPSKTTEDFIEQYAAEVNQLRREIDTLHLQGKDAPEDLVFMLAKAESNLDEWIDFRVKDRKLQNKQLPF